MHGVLTQPESQARTLFEHFPVSGPTHVASSMTVFISLFFWLGGGRHIVILIYVLFEFCFNLLRNDHEIAVEIVRSVVWRLLWTSPFYAGVA